MSDDAAEYEPVTPQHAQDEDDNENYDDDANGSDDGGETDTHANPYRAEFDPDSLNTISYERIVDLIREADAVLIGGGAGLSASAGLDYNDKVMFAQQFPALVKRGFSHMYQFVGLPASRYGPEGDRLAWGYRIASTKFILGLPKHPVYENLFEVVKNKNYFVITSNVDIFFEKNGFDVSRLWTPQGDWRYLQCLQPCRDDAVWESAPTIERVYPQIDQATQLIPESAVPKCPHCNGPVSFNLRGGDWYLDTKYRDQEARFDAWLSSPAVANGKLLVFDCGSGWSGYNTPSVVRLRVERCAIQHPNANFIRVNKFAPELHGRHGERGFSLAVFADEFARDLKAAHDAKK